MEQENTPTPHPGSNPEPVTGDLVSGDKVNGDKVMGDKVEGDKVTVVVANAEEAGVVLSSLRWSWPKAWDFTTYCAEKREGFVGREWIFEEVRAWANDPHSEQALLISADYGVGKSAFLAQLIETGAAGIPIAAEHFCTTEQADTLTAELFVRSLAAQLAESLPAYRKKLEADVATELRRWLDESNKDPARALEQAVLAPLAALDPAPEPQLLVVDALDEAQDPVTTAVPGSSHTIVALLARYAKRLPPWLKLLATSRRRPDVLKDLRQNFTLKEIDAEEARNLADLRTYAVVRCLQSPLREILLQADLTPEEVGKFLSTQQQSSGKFLYVERVLKDLQTRIPPLGSRADLEALPPGLDGFYADAFHRRFPRKEEYVLVEPILAVLTEAREPMARKELAVILSCEEQDISDRLRPLRDFLRLRPSPIERDGVTSQEMLYSFDHLSLQQWLTEVDVEELLPRAGRFSVNRQAAAERIHRWAMAEVTAKRAHTWPYLVRQLASHLSVYERAEVIGGQLLQFPWLQSRLKLAGLNALLGDFNPIIYEPNFVPSELKALEQALNQSAYVLSHVDGWNGQEQLASQLLARLADEAAPNSLRHQMSESLHKAGGASPRAASLATDDALLRTLPVGKAVNAMVALPDGLMVSGCCDGTIRIWDPDSGSCTSVLEGHGRGVNNLVVLGDGRLASGSADKTIRIWDPESGSCTAVLEGHENEVNALVVLGDGRLASSSADKTIRIWDTASGSCTAVFKGHGCRVNKLAVLLDGRIASVNGRYDSGSEDTTIRIWDPDSGSCTVVYEALLLSNRVKALEVLGDGRLAIGFMDSIHIWDPATASSTNFIPAGSGLNALAVLSDGRLAAGYRDNTISIWDTASGSCTAVLEGHGGGVNALAVAGDGRLASGSDDNTIRIWDTASGSCTAVFKGHGCRASALAVLSDGRIASGSKDKIRLLDPASGSCTAVLKSYENDWVDHLAVLGEGSLASGSRLDTIHIWDIDSGSCTAVFYRRFHGLSIQEKFYEKLFCVLRLAIIRVINLNTGSRTSVFKVDINSVDALAVLSDGRLACGEFERIHILDPISGSCTRILDKKGGGKSALVVLCDGRLASSSRDNIRLWDAKSGSCTAVLEGHEDEVNALAVLGDGRLASGSKDNTIRIWDPARPDGTPRVIFVADAAINTLVWQPTHRLLIAKDASGKLHWLEFGFSQIQADTKFQPQG